MHGIGVDAIGVVWAALCCRAMQEASSLANSMQIAWCLEGFVKFAAGFDSRGGSPDRKAAARAASDVTGVEREGTKKVDGDGSGVDADAGGEGKVTEDEDAKVRHYGFV